MKIHLVISALGKDRPGILSELSKAILDNACSILDSRMTVLGSEFAAILLVAGNWSSVAKLEDALAGLHDSLNLTITAKRTEPPISQAKLLPYIVEIATVEQPGIVYRLADFFTTRTISIQELYTGCYSTPHSDTPLFSLNMTVNIPSDLHIASLREQFMDFCDELNLDGVIEPLKR
jgi:glycine cleavage system transcriptional repressor